MEGKGGAPASPWPTMQEELSGSASAGSSTVHGWLRGRLVPSQLECVSRGRNEPCGVLHTRRQTRPGVICYHHHPGGRHFESPNIKKKKRAAKEEGERTKREGFFGLAGLIERRNRWTTRSGSCATHNVTNREDGKEQEKKRKTNKWQPLEALSCRWIASTGEGGWRSWLLPQRPTRSANGGVALRFAPRAESSDRNHNSDLEEEKKRNCHKARQTGHKICFSSSISPLHK